MTPAPRSRHTPRAARPLATLFAVCAALVAGPAVPASAHGPTPDGTNYRSAVSGVRGPDGMPVAGVSWRVLGGDGLLHVRTTGETEVVVIGYDDEPFLRVGPDGVYENRNSPATYLNADRFATMTVPADVDASAPPDWARVGDGTAWQWHDHRIHWMAPTPPPAVRDRADVEQRILQWVVPFEVEHRQHEVHGALDYVPPPAVWAWLLAAPAVLALPIVVLAARRAERRRCRSLR